MPNPPIEPDQQEKDEGREWPEVLLSRLHDEADPENYEVHHKDFPPAEPRETYVPVALLASEQEKRVELEAALEEAKAALGAVEYPCICVEPGWGYDSKDATTARPCLRHSEEYRPEHHIFAALSHTNHPAPGAQEGEEGT